MLPAFPAVSLLCGDGLHRWLRGRGALPRAVDAGVLGLAALAGVGTLAASLLDPVPNVDIPLGFGVAVAAAAAIAAAAWVHSARGGAPALQRVGVAIAFFFAVELATATLLLPALDPEKSPRPVARAAAELTPPGRPIGLVGSSGLLGGLRYYGDRPVLPLRSSEGIRAYLEAGGTAIVVQAEEAARVREVAPVEVHASAREGDRELLVLAPAGAVGAGAEPS